MKNGIILRKLAEMDTVLAELRSLGERDLERLSDDWRTRRAVERDLQILVEIVIDVCQRLLALAGRGPVDTGAEAVRACVTLGALADPAPYRRMIQFRNFVVHRYEHVDPGVLADIVRNRLGDFDRFREEVLSYVHG
ncbi:type VII toxin-antitoxin system HepT family RNase toxin [Deferrisoma camini]|uniref:type VII toxin-antitoxin system HepT family RNase toxin n=1 Tax=Deferrisoma camini TaxID=1035120 RepID=UPI00046D77F7|nr:DUF86 domain-containing protein [Deferrisoma camini]